jgi:hypothetical protein
MIWREPFVYEENVNLGFVSHSSGLLQHFLIYLHWLHSIVAAVVYLNWSNLLLMFRLPKVQNFQTELRGLMFFQKEEDVLILNRLKMNFFANANIEF